MEARESQRDIMRLANAEDAPTPASAASEPASHHSLPRPYLDLAVRHKVEARSTVTSLESLASSIDLTEDKNLKRHRDVISNLDKESQVKEQRNSFRGMFPSGDNKAASTKKTRKNDNE